MIRFIFLLTSQLIFTGFILAQNDDTSSKHVDSVSPIKGDLRSNDSLNKRTSRHAFTDSLTRIKSNFPNKDSSLQQSLKDTAWIGMAKKYAEENFIHQAFKQNKIFNFSSAAITITSNKKEFKGKEVIFYALITILLFFAVIRYSYPKYILDLFRVTFRTTLKRRQISEQLIQTPVPSLLLNFFFLISGSLYISFLLQHYDLTRDYNFWLLSSYCFLALMTIYLIKFLSLKFSGWLFNISPTTDSYIFIVFIINKILGIYLLPFLILLAFTEGNIYEVALTISYIGIFVLLVFRFILSYGLIQNQIRLNPFHFFLYLCAFEIIPLLLIYKALVLWF